MGRIPAFRRDRVTGLVVQEGRLAAVHMEKDREYRECKIPPTVIGEITPALPGDVQLAPHFRHQRADRGGGEKEIR